MRPALSASSRRLWRRPIFGAARLFAERAFESLLRRAPPLMRISDKRYRDGRTIMPSITAIDEATGRKFYLDDPDDLQPGEAVTFLLNLHGGGSVGAWQRAYFPAQDYKNQHRL